MRSVNRPARSTDRSRVKEWRLDAGPRHHFSIRPTSRRHIRKQPSHDSPSGVGAVACPERSCCPTRRATEKTLVSISFCVLCSSPRNLCILCVSAVKGNENACKPQRRRECRGYAEKPVTEFRTQVSIQPVLRVRAALAATTRTGGWQRSAVFEWQRDFDD